MSNLTPEMIAEYRRKPKKYMEENLWIKTKQAIVAPFKLNRAQIKVLRVIVQLMNEGKPIRLIILKARQMGVSTLIEGFIFWYTTLHKNISAIIVAHLKESASKIFSMSKLFFENLDPELRPMHKYSNRRVLDFSNPSKDPQTSKENPGLRSEIVVDSAENVNVGRSLTIHMVHGSEVAFWRDPEKTLLSLQQAVPKGKHTFIALESTANGVGDLFYHLYFDAKKGKNAYTAIFLAWHEFDEYYIEPSKEENWAFKRYLVHRDIYKEKVLRLDKVEAHIIKVHDLSFGQIRWRRWCIENNCNGDPEKFKQEYPSSDLEAFLVSGRSAFNVEKLQQLYDLCPEPEAIGKFEMVRNEIHFVEDPQGDWKIWKFPKVDGQYVMGADVAEGKLVKANSKEGDRSTVDILDHETMEQVAHYSGHPDTDSFADEINLAARYYNHALAGPECNNAGLACINELKKKYYRIYRSKKYNRQTNQTTKELGWRTDMKTKKLMVEDLARVIRDESLIINNKDSIGEMLSFVKDDEGKYAGQEGSFDDRVISLAIAVQLFIQTPFIEDDELNDTPQREIVSERCNY